MSKTYIRVDDRLIHGQITTTWIQHLNIKSIVVADDKTSSNPMIKSIIAMAAPPKIVTKIIKVEEAYAVMKENLVKNINQLVIVKLPETLPKVCFKDIHIEKIIVGTVIKKSTSIKQIGTNVFLTKEDIDALNLAKEEGCEVEVRMLPNSSSVKW